MAKKSTRSVRARRQQQLEAAARRRRLIYGGSVLGVVLIIALFVVIRQLNAPTHNIEDVVVPASLEPPANADGTAWGPVDAPVVIEEYSDFQCPFCGQFATITGEQLKQAYADSGLVRFEYNHFAFLGPESLRAAEAAECAAEQNLFWPYHDIIFNNQSGENQGNFSDPALRNFAIVAGLEMEAFDECFSSARYRQDVRAGNSEASNRGVNSTPTFFVNGELVEGVISFEQFETIIASELE